MITQELLHNYFEYKDGKLLRKIVFNNRNKLHEEAGWVKANGYRYVSILSKSQLVHRMIYFMFYNTLPKYVDHIDGNPLNNKIENLRAATNAQNNWNTGIRKTNTSGVKGVYWDKKYNSWHAQCFVNYKNHFLGRYENIDDAKKSVQEFRLKHHGEFARHQ
jgi:hypothetical protein